ADSAPLASGREPRATSPAQARRLDLGDDRVGVEISDSVEAQSTPGDEVLLERRDRRRVEDPMHLRHRDRVPAGTGRQTELSTCAGPPQSGARRSPPAVRSPITVRCPRVTRTIAELLADARASLQRVSPAEAVSAAERGALLVDIRPSE